jgi:hypothetical protein
MYESEAGGETRTRRIVDVDESLAYRRFSGGHDASGAAWRARTFIAVFSSAVSWVRNEPMGA